MGKINKKQRRSGKTTKHHGKHAAVPKQDGQVRTVRARAANQQKKSSATLGPQQPSTALLYEQQLLNLRERNIGKLHKQRKSNGNASTGSSNTAAGRPARLNIAEPVFSFQSRNEQEIIKRALENNIDPSDVAVEALLIDEATVPVSKRSADEANDNINNNHSSNNVSRNTNNIIFSSRRVDSGNSGGHMVGAGGVHGGGGCSNNTASQGTANLSNPNPFSCLEVDDEADDLIGTGDARGAVPKRLLLNIPVSTLQHPPSAPQGSVGLLHPIGGGCISGIGGINAATITSVTSVTTASAIGSSDVNKSQANLAALLSAAEKADLEAAEWEEL